MSDPAQNPFDLLLDQIRAVDRLEIFSLSHRIFKTSEFWHGRRKLGKALMMAA